MSSASASSGGAGPEIAALLHEFTLGLGAAPAERPLEPAFDDRMREVMVKLVDSVMSPLAALSRPLDADGMRKLQGRVKSVISLVKLVVHALSRFPTMLAGEHRIKAWTVASRLLPTLKEPLLQPAHGSTLNALFLLFGILGANASREGLALFSDLVNLLEDLALCEELLTQYPGAEMSLTILGEFHAVITAESVATGGGLLHTVTSPASAKTLAVNVCKLLHALALVLPPNEARLASPRLHGVLRWCSGPHKDCQAAALDALHAVARVGVLESLGHDVVAALAEGVRSWDGLEACPRDAARAIAGIVSSARPSPDSLDALAYAVSDLLQANPVLLPGLEPLCCALLQEAWGAGGQALYPALVDLLPDAGAAQLLVRTAGDECGSTLEAGHDADDPPAKRQRTGVRDWQTGGTFPSHGAYLDARLEMVRSRFRESTTLTTRELEEALMLGCVLASRGGRGVASVTSPALELAHTLGLARASKPFVSSLRALACLHALSVLAAGDDLEDVRVLLERVARYEVEGQANQALDPVHLSFILCAVVGLRSGEGGLAFQELERMADGDRLAAGDACRVIEDAVRLAQAMWLANKDAASPGPKDRARPTKGAESSRVDPEASLTRILKQLTCTEEPEVLRATCQGIETLMRSAGHTHVCAVRFLVSTIAGLLRSSTARGEAPEWGYVFADAVESLLQRNERRLQSQEAESSQMRSGGPVRQRHLVWPVIEASLACSQLQGAVQEAALLAAALLVPPDIAALAAKGMRPRLQACLALATSTHAHVQSAVMIFARTCASALLPPDAQSAGVDAMQPVTFLRNLVGAVSGNPREYLGALRTLAALVSSAADLQPQDSATALVMLVDALDPEQLDAEALGLVSAVAGQLLSNIARAQGNSVASYLRGQPWVLEYITRNLESRPALFHELAELVQVETWQGRRAAIASGPGVALAAFLLPVVLPRLCALGDRTSLRHLAWHLRYEGSNPEWVLVQNFLHVAIGRLVYERVGRSDGAERLGETLSFIEGLGEGEDRARFAELLSGGLTKLFWEVLWLVADNPAFQALSNKLTLPAQEVADCGAALAPVLCHMLEEELMGRKGEKKGHMAVIQKFLMKDSRIMEMLHYASDYCDGRVPRNLAPLGAPPTGAADTVRAVRVMAMLVSFAGAQVTEVAPQFSALLTRALTLQGAAVRSASLGAWAVLVDTLAAHARAELARMASHIVVVLLPLLDDTSPSRDAAARVMHRLVIDNGAAVGQEALQRLPPLTSVDGLDEVNATLSHARGNLTAMEQVALLSEGLEHEAESVRLASLGELLHHLRGAGPFAAAVARQLEALPSATDLVVGDSQPGGKPDGNSRATRKHPGEAIFRLVRGLLACASADSPSDMGRRIQLRCAECLGVLGAIDPARLPVRLARDLVLHTRPLFFAKDVAEQHLVRLLRVTPSLSVLSNAMLAVQTLLQLEYEPGERQLFDVLRADVQPVVRPFLESKFRGEAPRPSDQGVLFSPTLSFRAWLHAWIRQLMDFVDPGPWKSAFDALRGLLHHDVQLMLYALHHVACQVVASGAKGTAAADRIREEIVAVLLHAQQGPDAVDPLALQAVFGLLDTIGRYVYMCQLEQRRASRSGSGSSLTFPASGDLSPGDAEELENLLRSVDLGLLARASYACGAHERALLYLERHMRGTRGNAGTGLNPAALVQATFEPGDVAFLQRVYAALDEPDGLAGVQALQSGPLSLDLQILLAEKTGHFSRALALYGQAAHTARAAGADMWPLRRGQLRCMLRLGQQEQVLHDVNGLAACGEVGQGNARELASWGAAAAWRMAQWDDLDEFLEDAGAGRAGKGGTSGLGADEGWEVQVGEILSAARRGDAEGLADVLASARREVMRPLSAATMESYSRAYPLLVRLHVLQELEEAAVMFLVPGREPSRRELEGVLRWGLRLALTEQALATQEPVLEAREKMARLLGVPGLSGELSLQRARACREARHLEVADICALEAMREEAPGAVVEVARLMWARDHPDRAIKLLEHALADIRAGNALGSTRPMAEDTEAARGRAEVALHLAVWKAETGQGGHEEVMGLFDESKKASPAWHRPYFELAKYTDALMEGARQRQLQNAGVPEAGLRFGSKSKISVHFERPWAEYAPAVISSYCQAVVFGSEVTFQALPRMLTVFFLAGSPQAAEAEPSTGADARAFATRSKVQRRSDVTEVVKALRTHAKGVPVYLWLSVLPQLVSRIVHQHQDIYGVAKSILVRATRQYPGQALWMLASSVRSQSKVRKERVLEVLQSAKSDQRRQASPSIFAEFEVLHSRLQQLCTLPAPKTVKTLSFKANLPEFERALPCSVLLPIRQTMNLVLPPDSAPPADDKHVAFPVSVSFHGVEDAIELLASLMRPKKIRVRGSDGEEYWFLAKPKDDLRKDTRMMEMASVMNRVFARDPAARQRSLKMRTYYVAPLVEDSGLVEWVKRTSGFRNCCQEVYVLDGMYDGRKTNEEVQDIYNKGIAAKKRSSDILDEVLSRFPPRLHKWFISRYFEPSKWLQARKNFTCTTAVWSMVGHVVGLGDRHGENILIDASSGDAVMIDFGCLFDKGLTLEKPELVPFRLTQNVVDAMGVTGVEGSYRKVCEMTLAALRANRDTVMSVAESFVHDPLVDWSWRSSKSPRPEEDAARRAAEGENPAALDALRQIQGRINGTLIGVASIPSLSLSVEGHVHRLIQEAVDKDNLGGMYIWWMPWI